MDVNSYGLNEIISYEYQHTSLDDNSGYLVSLIVALILHNRTHSCHHVCTH